MWRSNGALPQEPARNQGQDLSTATALAATARTRARYDDTRVLPQRFPAARWQFVLILEDGPQSRLAGRRARTNGIVALVISQAASRRRSRYISLARIRGQLREKAQQLQSPTNVGPGRHYLQEDHPEAIGKAIAEWIKNGGSNRWELSFVVRVPDRGWRNSARGPGLCCLGCRCSFGRALRPE